MDTLNRDQAQLPREVWEAIDGAAVEAAKPRLTGRRFLDMEGPFGTGLTTIEVGNEDYCRQTAPGQAAAVMGRAISVPMLRRPFSLSVRRVAASLRNGQPIDLTPMHDAAEAIADLEEDVIDCGQPEFNLSGLLTHEGRRSLDGRDWSAVEGAQADVVAAVPGSMQRAIAVLMHWRWRGFFITGCCVSIRAPM
jgi:uncharacterized linocin/CFP29 family protein